MEYIPELYKKRVLILGCGNILFGDDGFGPALCEYIKNNFKLPHDIGVEDCGTGIREVLFNIILSSKRPEEIVIVDAVDVGKKPGELFWIDIEELPHIKVDDFSMHLFPTSNLLLELRDECNVKVSILSCQVGYIPDKVLPGLTKDVEAAIKKAADILSKRYFIDT